MPAFAMALIGAIVVWIGFAHAGKYEPGLRSRAIKACALIVGLLTIPLIQAVSGASPDANARAGEYWVCILFAFWLLSKMSASSTR